MGQRQDREWTRDFRYFNEDTGQWEADPDRSEDLLHAEVGACAAIMHREGGAFILSPYRVEQPPLPDSLDGKSSFVNVGVNVQHKFLPAQRAPKPEPEAVPAPPPLEEVALLEGDEPSAVMPQPSDPGDVHTEPVDPSMLAVPVQ